VLRYQPPSSSPKEKLSFCSLVTQSLYFTKIGILSHLFDILKTSHPNFDFTPQKETSYVLRVAREGTVGPLVGD